jgi:hypothetical protein
VCFCTNLNAASLTRASSVPMTAWTFFAEPVVLPDADADLRANAMRERDDERL